MFKPKGRRSANRTQTSRPFRPYRSAKLWQASPDTVIIIIPFITLITVPSNCATTSKGQPPFSARDPPLSEHRFPTPSSKKGCRKPLLGVRGPTTYPTPTGPGVWYKLQALVYDILPSHRRKVPESDVRSVGLVVSPISPPSHPHPPLLLRPLIFLCHRALVFPYHSSGDPGLSAWPRSSGVQVVICLGV